MGRQHLRWPLLLLVSSVAAVGVTALAAPPLIRLPVNGWFLLFCPGFALTRLMGLGDRVAVLVLSVALSLALDTLVAVALLYTGRWSPPAALLILALATSGGALVQFRRPAAPLP